MSLVVLLYLMILIMEKIILKIASVRQSHQGYGHQLSVGEPGNIMLLYQNKPSMIWAFNEIQFDYVRFPEDAYNMSQNSSTDFKNKYNEEKAEAVQNFLYYAADQIHKENVYLSVDVFWRVFGYLCNIIWSILASHFKYCRCH